jgi:Fe2+ transport system protein B
MPTFYYTALNLHGEKVQDKLEATNQQEAIDTLKSHRLIPTLVERDRLEIIKEEREKLEQEKEELQQMKSEAIQSSITEQEQKSDARTKKAAYLERIRNETSYSFLRSLLIWCFVLFVFAAFIYFILSVVEFDQASTYKDRVLSEPHSQAAKGYFGICILLPMLGSILMHCGNVILDIADSTIDLNYRYDEQ